MNKMLCQLQQLPSKTLVLTGEGHEYHSGLDFAGDFSIFSKTTQNADLEVSKQEQTRAAVQHRRAEDRGPGSFPALPCALKKPQSQT